ncbi:MAG: hypothetical protein AB7E60_15360 [Sphingobium sp.]
MADIAPIAAEAQAALDRREKHYPAMVATGKLQPDRAEWEIMCWRAIAAQWRWVLTGERGGDGPAITDRQEVVALSIRRCDAQLGRIIATLPDNIRRDCAEGFSIDELRAIHGEAVAPLIAIRHQREHLISMRDLYRDGTFRDLARLRAALLASEKRS